MKIIMQEDKVIDMIRNISNVNDENYRYFIENYETIITKRNPDNLSTILEELYNSDILKNFFYQKLIYNLDIAKDLEFYRIVINRNIDMADYCQNNIVKIINQLEIEKVLWILDKINILEKDKEYVLNYLNKNEKQYLEHKMYEGFHLVKGSMEEKDTLLDVITMLTNEILEHENKTLLDIIYATPGGYSDIYIIGSKVLKLGAERETYKIPYHKRIITPIIRVNLADISHMNGTIEVMELVDMKAHISNIEQEEIVYEMLDTDIIGTDYKRENFGTLLKDNIIHWNKPISYDLSTRGFINAKEEEPLKAGDKAIIDSDYVYYTSDYRRYYIGQELRKIESDYINENKRLKLKGIQ